MSDINFSSLKDFIISNNPQEIFSDAMIGFEKESMRVNNSRISNLPHPKELGSSLCNKFITTDFSEAQLELITPPTKGNSDCLKILGEIHHFVSSKIDNEIIWPLSIPPNINSQYDIPIAKFGSSNEGMFKHIYRLGLANRYGRAMQSISGLHFNYSLPSMIWNFFQGMESMHLKDIKSELYFNLIRNIYEMNWLLIYLFGASPVIDKRLLNTLNDNFEHLDKNSLYLPHATSLRMSEYGYSNIKRKGLYISVNSLDEYISTLKYATTTEDKDNMGFEDDNFIQLNKNLLQIEAEFYATARAKSNHIEDKIPSINLFNYGVDFVEIRSLDLNPFSSIGITKETVIFLELFLIFCLSKEAKQINQERMEIINHNDLVVAKYGRDRNQRIRENGTFNTIKDSGNRILDLMAPYAELMDTEDTRYSLVLSKMKSQIDNPDETISARIIESIKSKNISHLEFGNNLGERYKSEFLKNSSESNSFWERLEDEALDSVSRNRKLEEITRQEKIPFDKFKEEYFT